MSLTTGEVIEDATFLAESGVGMREAAKRMGTTVGALEMRLYRAEAHELVAWLRAQDPAWPQNAEANRTRYGRWAATPEGAAILAEHRRWLAFVRGQNVVADTEQDQAARRLVIS